jgi:hypothetical protein
MVPRNRRSPGLFSIERGLRGPANREIKARDFGIRRYEISEIFGAHALLFKGGDRIRAEIADERRIDPLGKRGVIDRRWRTLRYFHHRQQSIGKSVRTPDAIRHAPDGGDQLRTRRLVIGADRLPALNAPTVMTPAFSGDFSRLMIP